ncbi:hypothetical protein TSUD_221460 [Trifolium subterraneum]|uniref:CCHC-type domain-containing protein n=1 Tax=Trifolium subterraneum TaxID=3900 RepID=A0A2Z6MN68_TRISU|nr:hypothetical protein TSUD_221460 [Trifolium subterraneum]
MDSWKKVELTKEEEEEGVEADDIESFGDKIFAKSLVGKLWTENLSTVESSSRSDAMAKKLGDVIGEFVEVDLKDGNRLGKFLRVKVTVDLRKPLKRGIVVKYQGKNLRVFFKYERLPTFCFACGKIGHQIKDCEEMEGKGETEFDEIEEKEFPFGQWMKASPLPKALLDIKKDNSSSSCGKSLFAESEVESVAESLGNAEITTQVLPQVDKGSHTKPKPQKKQARKWARKKGARKEASQEQQQLVTELGKRQLVEVTISEVRALLRLIRLENPMCVFLMETRLKSFEMEGLKQRCGFNSCLTVDCRGLGKERAGDEEDNQNCHFTCMYGYPEECNKKKTWQLITELAATVESKWICFGDLNDIFTSDEKLGGNTRSPNQLMLGRNAIDTCRLIDLGYEGHPFTWTNGRELEENIQCRLDRALATEEFINRFSPIRVLHLPIVSEAEKILQVLLTYLLASGQVVNLDKSEASFSRNVLDEEKEMICNKMNVKTVLSHTRYLGLPVVFGRSKKEIFSFVIDRVWKKLKGWKEKFLSRVGKEVLIKPVAQAILSYIMGCYKLSEGCCNEIEGGMGFRGVRDFNKALLGKHCWRLLTSEETLMGRIFKSRYHPRGSFLEAKLGHLPSYAWRSIMSVKDVIMQGGKWQIGNGAKVRIWHDNWLPCGGSLVVKSQVKILHQDSLVSALIDQDTKQWNRDLIFSTFNQFEARLIVSIPLSFRVPDDNFIWAGEKDGKYSVRSAYHQLGDERRKYLPGPSHDPNDKLWRGIWRVNLPNKVKNFVWSVGHSLVPTISEGSKFAGNNYTVRRFGGGGMY